MRLFNCHQCGGWIGNADPRHKLLAILLSQASILYANSWALLLIGALITAFYSLLKLKLPLVIASMRPLLGIIAITILLRIAGALTDSGTIAHPSPKSALISASLWGYRLLIIALYAHCYIAITPVEAIVDTLRWLFRPLGKRTAERAALISGLALTFYPLVARDLRTISAAVSLRSGGRSRWKWLPLIGYNGMVAIAHRATRLGDALFMRCYTDDRAIAPFCRSPFDWTISLIGIATLAASVISNLPKI